MDFNVSIAENIKKKGSPFLVAHRGVNGANIPCNSMLSYKIAIDQGADVIEIDVAKSKDGKFFVFHPGMENIFIKCGKSISEMISEEIRNLRLLNIDGVPTHYTIPTLEEVLLFLKGKVYINVDKFWTDVEGITGVIRKCGVEKQVIVKTNPEEKYFSQIEQFASDFMYMAMVWHKDDISGMLMKRNINYIGIECLFDKLDDEIANKNYIDGMHKKGLLVWGNSIIYNEQDVISAGLTDDISLEKGGEFGWGKLCDLGFDFIQTDWLYAAKEYIKTR